MYAKSARLLRDVWALARAYWFSEERWSARGLLLLIILLNLGIVFLSVMINDWNRLLYNALQEYNAAAFLHQMLRFSVIAVFWVATQIYRVYLRQMLEMRWRRWMTAQYVGRWLAARTYYRLQLEGGATDNPDQRITEDLRDFTVGTLTLGIGLMESIVTLVSFAAILWGLSGTLTIPIGGFEIAIPGYMLWGALIYSVIGTWLTHLIGRPLIGLQFNRQRVEADFRFALVRFRENAESVALYGGEVREQRSFAALFTHVLSNWWQVMRRNKRLGIFTFGFGQAALIFPYLLAAPRYFVHVIELGPVMQTIDAFSQVQSAMSWFVDAYSALAEWKATVDRLTSFTAAMTRIEASAAEAAAIHVEPAPSADITVRGLELAVPGGHVLMSDASLTLRAGESLLLSGPSGSGKSTLFRAIAGIWPYGAGTIERPTAARLLFLPQKPYLPLGTLREVLTYPAPVEGLTDAMIVEALRACELSQLVDRLDERQHWAQLLSPGEQQRIAFARALLMKPDWLFLDEASAALDEALENRLYQLLPGRLPATTVVSIGHRPSLRAFHARQVELRFADGGWGLHDVALRAAQ
jgi:putative ATP-binding cassette transporter